MVILLLSPIVTHAADSQLLWLVNRENTLPSTYRPQNLITHQGVTLRREALEAYLFMEAAMKADGIQNLRLLSAYRPYNHQKAIFSRRVKELEVTHTRAEATEKAAWSVQPPGASEHQLGLALDVTTDGKLTQAFGGTPAGQWLADNCHRYGFIIRYSAAHTQTTCIIYEPWHLRYVGTPHAAIMQAENLPLEAYGSYIKAAQMYVFWGEGEYYLLSYSDTPPQDGAFFSSVNPGKTGYIITRVKPRPRV